MPLNSGTKYKYFVLKEFFFVNRIYELMKEIPSNQRPYYLMR
jgi:hypothetical protein